MSDVACHSRGVHEFGNGGRQVLQSSCVRHLLHIPFLALLVDSSVWADLPAPSTTRRSCFCGASFCEFEYFFPLMDPTVYISNSMRTDFSNIGALVSKYF